MPMIEPTTKEELIDAILSIDACFSIKSAELLISIGFIGLNNYVYSGIIGEYHIDLNFSDESLISKDFYIYEDGKKITHRGDDMPQYIGYINGNVDAMQWNVKAVSTRNNYKLPTYIYINEPDSKDYSDFFVYEQDNSKTISLYIKSLLGEEVVELKYFYKNIIVQWKVILQIRPDILDNKLFDYFNLDEILTNSELDLIEILSY